ncbi:hypothetical protein PYCCODRAFT_1356941, partial [Trametes coccinea BRFM310]
LHDVIHRNVLPWSMRDLQRLEETKGLVPRSFDVSARVAGLDVLTYVGRDPGPGEVASDQLLRVFASWVT